MSAEPVTPATWTHRDSHPKEALDLALGARSYLVRPDGTAMSTADRVRIVRTLAIATGYAVENARVVGVPALKEKEVAIRLGAEVRPELYATKDHWRAASAIAQTWELFADPGYHRIYTAVTADGEPAQLARDPVFPGPGEEAAFPPLLAAAVIVAAVTVHAAAICYVAQIAGEVIDRKLTRDADTARMVATQAQAVALVDNHSERERKEGRVIPWSPEETRVLDTLLKTQAKIAERTNKPLPNPFANVADKVGDAAESTFSGVGIAVALAAGAYVLLK